MTLLEGKHQTHPPRLFTLMGVLQCSYSAAITPEPYEIHVFLPFILGFFAQSFRSDSPLLAPTGSWLVNYLLERILTHTG